MDILRNENGVALITALLLTLISLVIAMMLLYMVIMGTKMSAAQKRYKNSLAASYGGVELFTGEVIPKLFQGYSTSKISDAIPGIDLNIATTNACLQQKVKSRVADWTSCNADSMTADPKKSPDMSFRLPGMSPGSDYTVFAKIVDTKPGNSDQSGNYLDAGVAVAGNVPGVPPPHQPSLLTIEVQGERSDNPQEKANLSVLYMY